MNARTTADKYIFRSEFVVLVRGSSFNERTCSDMDRWLIFLPYSAFTDDESWFWGCEATDIGFMKACGNFSDVLVVTIKLSNPSPIPQKEMRILADGYIWKNDMTRTQAMITVYAKDLKLKDARIGELMDMKTQSVKSIRESAEKKLSKRKPSVT